MPHIGQAFFNTREVLGKQRVKNPQQGLHSGMCLEGEDLSMNHEFILKISAIKLDEIESSRKQLYNTATQRVHSEPGGSSIAERTL